MDELHKNFRMVIDTAWRNLAGQQAFKGAVIDYEMMSWGAEEFSLENQISNKMICGVSANRMCELLTNNPMNDIIKNPKTVNLADTNGVKRALTAIQKTPGYNLIRINVDGGGVGHAYIFLTFNRMPADPIDGYIYQTNVGCHVSNAFGLNDWIRDPQSSETVNLPSHLKDLAGHLCGIEWSEESLKATEFYQKNYMLSGNTLKESVRIDIEKKSKESQTRAHACFIWAPVQVAKAKQNFMKIRDAAMFNKLKV